MKYAVLINKNNQEMQLKIKAENEAEAIQILNQRYNPDYIIEISDNKSFIHKKQEKSAYDRAWSRRHGSYYMKNANSRVVRIFS